MFSLICVWMNDWVNNREAGDLKRYQAHCDVTVMLIHFQGVIIRNSGLQSVDSDAFTNLSALQDLMLINGSLTQPPPLQCIRKTLILLDLRSNYIAHIDKLYFAGCMKLATLSLERNLLSSMPDISYVVQTLTILNLSRNKLSGTYLYFTVIFPRLQTIYLDFNYLTGFCMQQITYLPFVGLISLNGNNITLVGFEYLQGWREVIVLITNNNPLQCDRSWSNACKKHPTKPDLLCGDYLQIWGIKCTNNTGRVFIFDDCLKDDSFEGINRHFLLFYQRKGFQFQ